MNIIKTKLEGCIIIEPTIFGDERGYFFESYNEQNFVKAIGEKINFVQDNQSFSKKGSLRGLHFQKGIYAQAKLVRVLSGTVLDIAVDLRKNSITYGEYISVELSAENKKQLFVPRGFAHGFIVLSETAEFFYKCDNFYNKEAEGGIRYDDPDLLIDWRLEKSNFIISDKDKKLPFLKELDL